MEQMRILVVDDKSLNRFVLINILEQQGYRDCYEAESGHEALSLAKQINPDLILLGTVKNQLSGYDIAPILKRRSKDIYLPIIFITGLDDEQSLARCLEVGGDDFMAKPFNKTILAAKIRAHQRTRVLSKKSYEQNQQLIFHRNSVEREHKIVEHIFANALDVDERVQKYIDYHLQPASNFNGDLLLFSASPAGGLYFLIGDFTGHGLASAIGALPVSQAFQTMSSKGLSIREMARTLNSILLTLLPDDMFFAAALVEISPCGTNFDVWNGGMPTLLAITQNGNIEQRFLSQNMALGILEEDEFSDQIERFVAKIGDRLIGYSDGVVEVTNQHNEMLSEQRLENWFMHNPSISVEKLFAKVFTFSEGLEANDDLTFVSFTCQPLSALEKTVHTSGMPFSLEIALEADVLQKRDPVLSIVNMLCSQTGMHALHSRLFTVLSELFTNALDHGVLRLESSLKHSEEGFEQYFFQRTEQLAALNVANISFAIEFIPSQRLLKIKVTDSGPGFDFQNHLDDHLNDNLFGRGITLVKELSDTIFYTEPGNCVEVTFNI